MIGHKFGNPNCNNRQLTKEFRFCNSCMAKEIAKDRRNPKKQEHCHSDDSWVHDSDMESR